MADAAVGPRMGKGRSSWPAGKSQKRLRRGPSVDDVASVCRRRCNAVAEWVGRVDEDRPHDAHVDLLIGRRPAPPESLSKPRFVYYQLLDVICSSTPAGPAEWRGHILFAGEKCGRSRARVAGLDDRRSSRIQWPAWKRWAHELIANRRKDQVHLLT